MAVAVLCCTFPASAANQAALIVRGEKIYSRACAACHGISGDSKGPAAKAFSPAPRDFTKASFRLRSTPSGKAPTDEDLDRTLRGGVPGTSMPAWGNILSPADRAAVIAYLKSFSPQFSDESKKAPPMESVTAPRRPFPASPDSIAKGKAVWEKIRCAECHGEQGRGDGNGIQVLTDDQDNPLTPHDFARGVYKSGRTDADLYRSVTTGLDGTEMMAYDKLLTDEERWQVVDYVMSMASERDIWWRLFKERP
ncbi:MAG: c-type cytochrome [Bdellovibrionota bacterium]